MAFCSIPSQTEAASAVLPVGLRSTWGRGGRLLLGVVSLIWFIMTKPKPKDQLQKRGRKSVFRPEYILIAKACARFGAIEDEIANELNIGPATLDRWKQKFPEFRCALKAGKEASDDRVERSLYQLAIGWNGQPPNTTAAIFWLKNRRPDRWRDVQKLQSELGVYILSDKPLSEQEWIEQRTIVEQKRKTIEGSATETRHGPDTPEDTEV
jgi:hypothetical protein